jgi:hypothetical protein
LQEVAGPIKSLEKFLDALPQCRVGPTRTGQVTLPAARILKL